MRLQNPVITLDQTSKIWARDSMVNYAWSAVSLKKTHDFDGLYTWARDMVMWYWSADTLFWQLLIGHNMDDQYQRYKPT